VDRDAVIVSAVRTPVGRRGGTLASTSAIDISAQVLSAVVGRVGVDPGDVDDVFWGCVQQVGEQAVNIGRGAVLSAGWPTSVPAVTIDRQCGSSQQAVQFAAATVISGQADVVAAGGVEMMSRIPLGSNRGEGLGEPITAAMRERFGVTRFHQGVAAEMMASRWGLDRGQLDEYALRSHDRAATAVADKLFEDEKLQVALDDGSTATVDECIRPGTTLEALARLRPSFDEAGVIHPGNSSPISDGAAAVLVTTSAHARELGLTPLARIHASVAVGDDPVLMLAGPIPATRKVLERGGLQLSDISAFEVNEAFAPVPIAWIVETGADEALVNPLGGAIALGHPLGGSGARILTTLVHHLRRTGSRWGLMTMCEGGGMANATIIENLAARGVLP
jgi:acetyl-CoA acyltransferase